MKINVSKVLSALFCFLLLCFTSANGEEFKNYKAFYDAFKELKVDKEHVYQVRDLIFMQDAATTVLDSGLIYFMEDIGDGKHVAIFRGHGSFEVTPPLAVERANAKRHFGTEYYATDFEDASFIFDDDMFESISANSFKAGGKDWDEIDEIFHETWNGVCMPRYESVHSGISKALLEKGKSDFFYAEFFVGLSEQFAWMFDPSTREECTLYKVHDGSGNSAYDMEIVLTFDSAEDLLKSELERSVKKQNFRIREYDVDIDFWRGANYYSTARIKLEALEDFQWITFLTNRTHEVISVTADNDIGVSYYHQRPDYSNSVWINFSRLIKKGEKVWLTFKQDCNLKGQEALQNMSIYPVGFRNYDKKKFSLSVKSDPSKDIYAFGEKVHESNLDDGRVFTKWEYKDSIYQIGLILNNYKERTIEPDFGPSEVTFKYNRVNNLDMLETNYLIGYQYFSSIFGPLKKDKLYFYQLPLELVRNSRIYNSIYQQWSAFFTVVHEVYSFYLGTFICNDVLALNPGIFIVSGLKGIADYIDSLKELWLLDFEPKSFRDSWLMNGLSQFLVTTYVQNFYEDKSAYPELLDSYHKAFITKDDSNKDFADFGALGLGSIGGRRFRADANARDLKSFFIFHMLRNMFMDYQSDMPEQLFMTMIKDFYQTYKGKKYSVNDFRAIVEKHYGVSMKWFFDQWVDGTAIPTYKFASKTVQNENGHYVVKCQMSQEDVPENFMMLVPIRVEFDDNIVYTTRALMKGEKIQFEIGPFEDEPEDVICNPNYSVLSNTESKSWEEDF